MSASVTSSQRVTCVMTMMGHKGYCFVAPLENFDMKDVLLYKTTIYRSGLTEVPPDGTLIDCLVVEAEKGPQVMRIYSVRSRSGVVTEHAGKLKFFNTGKGYGIVTLESGADAFLHIEVVRLSGLNPTALQRDQRMRVKAGDHPKGLRVMEIISAS